MPGITAFVARSFDPRDEHKIQPILKFLNSLRNVGFVWKTAERAEVASVANKVRDLIDECDVFVGIFTRRHPIYRIESRARVAWKVLRGRLAPDVWTAPSWVLQESGYALKGNKDLILFREPNVEVPGLQGDLEYIEYRPDNLAPAFHRANEMIVGLIGKRAGVQVETIVRVSPTTEPQELEPPATPAEVQEPAPRETNIGVCYGEMLQAFTGNDLTAAREAYERGLALVKEQSPDLELVWRASYHRERFKAGDADALEELKSLQRGNPNEASLAAFIGACLSEFHEYEGAATQFTSAASLTNGEEKVKYAIRAAGCLRQANKYEQGYQILAELFNRAPSQTRVSILRALYDILKESGKTYPAFGMAEFALHENPGQNDFRFNLGLAYNRSKLYELFLYHYKVICEHETENTSAFHNLGLAYSKCDLPILSVSHYKRALELGETLTANNLGYKYLDCGFVDEATGVLRGAIEKEECAPEVASCLAAVDERRRQEIEKEGSKIETSRQHRDFLVALGAGFLSPDTPAIEGMWKFPFAEIDLKLSDRNLAGFGETKIEIPPSPLQTLLGGSRKSVPLRTLLGGSRESVTKLERFRFSGEIVGRTCKFEIKTESLGDTQQFTLAGTSTSITEGYIVFAADGQSADVAEFKDGKPEKYFHILRAQS